MSNFAAIGTVTAALQSILETPVEAAVPGARVRTQRPAGPTFTPAVGVNLYCYAVAPNPAWRNADVPTRDGDRLLQIPQAAVDLFYLITGYGDDTALEPQLLIGAVIATLHTQPVLTQPTVAAVLAAARVPPPDAHHPELKRGDLDRQVEQVRLCPVELSLEELSKLWTVFESPYSLSIAYRAGVVLLDRGLMPVPTATVRERAVAVLGLAAPAIERVVGEPGPTAPVTAGSRIVIEGSGLVGDVTLVRLTTGDVAPDAATDRRLVVTLPPGLLPGRQEVQVVHQAFVGTPPGPRGGAASNVASFILQSVVTAAALTAGVPGAGGLRAVTIDVTLDAPVAPAQALAMALVDPASGAARTVVRAPARVAASAAATFTALVSAGMYAVRVQVDAAESPLAGAPTVTVA